MRLSLRCWKLAVRSCFAKVKSNLSSVIGNGTKKKTALTGELERSLGLSPAKQKRDSSGWDVKVGFAEPRSDGGSNAKIATFWNTETRSTAKALFEARKSQSKERRCRSDEGKI